MTTAIFWLTQLTYQSRPMMNLFNSCVFHPILSRFGFGANIGLKIKSTYIQFEMNMAIFWLTRSTNQCWPLAYLFFRIEWNFVCGQLLDKKQHRMSFEIATTVFWLPTTTQTTAQAMTHSRGSKSPHHDQRDFMTFSLWQEPPLLVLIGHKTAWIQA